MHIYENVKLEFIQKDIFLFKFLNLNIYISYISVCSKTLLRFKVEEDFVRSTYLFFNQSITTATDKPHKISLDIKINNSIFKFLQIVGKDKHMRKA